MPLAEGGGFVVKVSSHQTTHYILTIYLRENKL